MRDEVGPADGAGSVGGQPLVDTVRMEDVVALGHEAERLGVLELVEADGAFQGTFSNLVNLDCGVVESREGADDGGIEAARLASGSSGEVGEGGAGRLAAVADVEGENAGEEESGDKNDDDDGHGGSVGVVVRASGASVIDLGAGEGERRREEEDEEEEAHGGG